MVVDSEECLVCSGSKYLYQRPASEYGKAVNIPCPKCSQECPDCGGQECDECDGFGKVVA